MLYDFKTIHGELKKEAAADIENEMLEDYPPDMIQLRAIDCSIPSDDEVDTMYPSYISPPNDLIRLLDEYSNISSK